MSDIEQKNIELPASIVVRDLAKTLEVSPIKIIKALMDNGVMVTINQAIDFDSAAIVAAELGFEAVPEVVEDESLEAAGDIPIWRQMLSKEKEDALVNRPPVVTILGHVDHGKTTLLDAIRHTDVAGGEAGGITQHIGAYQIEHNEQKVTFLDTPGHAAFTAMRARGAQGADIVVLVVAVNDGVMPQTREAIAHTKAAQVPTIVALNKIDRPDANPDFVKNQLAEAGLVPDEWDGDTIMVPVSAKEKTGIDDLLEAILLVAESKEIIANPEGKVFGSVIEAEIDKTKGVQATLLVQNGTLQTGDILTAGNASGRIRAMSDFRGKRIRKAGPSTPVQIMGLKGVPAAGDIFQIWKTDREARQFVADLIQAQADKVAASAQKTSLEDLFTMYQAGEVKELRLIVKADVQGSLEPITNSLQELKEGDIKVNVLHASTGNISENDIMLASASNAFVVGFNVKADGAARRLADTEGVSIRIYEIIYRLLEDIDKALKGMLEPEYQEKVIGEADVLAIFRASKVGKIAGCRVSKGEIRRNAKVRVLRDGKAIYDGELASLRHEKDDVREARQGFECGMAFKNFNDLEEGDFIQCYTLELFGG